MRSGGEEAGGPAWSGGGGGGGGGSGGGEVRRRPESEPRPRLRGAKAWQSLLGKLRTRARTLPAAPRDPGGLKRKPSACSSLGSPGGFALSQPASVPQKVSAPQPPRPPGPASDPLCLTYLYFSVSDCTSPQPPAAAQAHRPMWTSAHAQA